jgi:hypothetical protein
MAKSDILVRWKADTANYDANMAKAKRQLEQFGQQNMTAGGVVQQLSQKLVGTAAKFASFGAAAAAAMKVAKDAFFKNEQQLDDWGRTVKASESLYNGFLNSINNGSIGGYLSNIDRIVKAAREAYDALDELATYNAFNQVNVEKTRTGLTESIADFREGSGTKEAVRAAGEAYKKELRDRQRLESQAYQKAIADMAAQRGVSARDLADALSGTYGHYQDLKGVQPTGTRMVSYSGGMFGGGGSYVEKVAQTRQEQLGMALRQLNDTELQNLQALGAQAQRTGNEIAQVDKQLTRVLNGKGGAGGTTTTTGGGGGGKGGNTYIPVVGSIDAQAEKVEKLRKAWRAAADDDSRQKIKKEIEEAEFALEILEGKSSGIPTMNYGLGDLAGKSGSGLFQDPGFKVDNSPKVTWKLDSKAMDALGKEIERINTKSEVKLNEKVADITGGVSQVVGGIEALGIEVPEGMKNVLGGIQAVCTILTGISAIITAIQAIVAADAIIPFARGGVVHAANGYVTGNHYSGDLVPAMLNSGELVLNRAQQGNLASQLNDARGGAQLEAVITGEQLRLVLNNNGRRTGRGEVLTTKFY